MPRLSDIRIGTKLAAMSGIGVLLVAGMLAGALYGNAQVKSANGEAMFQQDTNVEVSKIEVMFINTRLAVRNIRLAMTKQELDSANTLSALQQKLDKLFEIAAPRMKLPENRERAEKAQAFINQYIAAALKEIIPVKLEAVGADTRDAAHVVELFGKTQAIQHEHLDPIADKAIGLLNEIKDSTTNVAKSNNERSEAEMTSAERTSIGIGATVILILIGSAFLGFYSIARPLRALVSPLGDLAAGNFAVTVPGATRKDEVGMIAAAAEAVVERVGGTIGNIKIAATEVTSASAEISTSTTDLSQRTEEQAASLEETSASMEQISATVRKNADNARQANDFASETNAVADRGGQVVAKAVDAMARIEESSRKISDIIGVIDEIARQTNLLALNAAVEAARAGEAGRGFAVVASEVRSLAQRSSQAAKDIKDLITSSNGQVKDGVDLVNKAGESLNEIVASIKKVSEIVADIANASLEQSAGIEQVNKALSQMDEVTQQNSALVEENAATAKTLQQQAKSMDERVAAFRLRADAARDGARDAGMARPAAAAVAPRAALPKAMTKRPPAPVKRVAVGNGSARHMQTALATAIETDADWKEF